MLDFLLRDVMLRQFALVVLVPFPCLRLGGMATASVSPCHHTIMDACKTILMTMAKQKSRPGRGTLPAEQISVDAFLADSVIVPDGKLYTLGGGWTTINTAQLPVRHPRLGIGMLIRVPYTLATNDPHRFEVRLVDSDENEMVLADAPPAPSAPADRKVRRLGAEFAVGRPPGIQAGDEQIVAVALNLDGLLFERAGVYVVVIAIDGEDVKRLRFRVNLLTQPTMIMS